MATKEKPDNGYFDAKVKRYVQKFTHYVTSVPHDRGFVSAEIGPLNDHNGAKGLIERLRKRGIIYQRGEYDPFNDASKTTGYTVWQMPPQIAQYVEEYTSKQNDGLTEMPCTLGIDHYRHTGFETVAGPGDETWLQCKVCGGRWTKQEVLDENEADYHLR